MVRILTTILPALVALSVVAGSVACNASADGPAAIVPTDVTASLPESPLLKDLAGPSTAQTLTETAFPTRTAAGATPTDVAPAPAPTRTALSREESMDASTPAVHTFRVVATYPHDPEAFTEGLVFRDGWLYESTGLRGRSTLRKVELETGEVVQIYALPDRFFGEGMTIWEDRIIQLTWQSNIGFVYDVYHKDSFELQREFRYPTEGWGLTHDGQRLIMSDGTATLRFLDPITLEEIGQVQVYDNEGPVARLNELEFIQGEVFANVWQTDRIARIDPQTGQVTGWIELVGILNADDLNRPVDVLNGIAYDATNERLFVTGKLWPSLFEIEIVDAAGSN